MRSFATLLQIHRLYRHGAQLSREEIGKIGEGTENEHAYKDDGNRGRQGIPPHVFQDEFVDRKEDYGKDDGPANGSEERPQYEVAQVPEDEYEGQHRKKIESLLGHLPRKGGPKTGSG